MWGYVLAGLAGGVVALFVALAIFGALVGGDEEYLWDDLEAELGHLKERVLTLEDRVTRLMKRKETP